MGYQSEAELENQLIRQLNEQGYKSVTIKDYDGLLANFREQFNNFNNEKLLRRCTRIFVISLRRRVTIL